MTFKQRKRTRNENLYLLSWWTTSTIDAGNKRDTFLLTLQYKLGETSV